MAYSNDYTEIRSGLVNFVGALLKSSHFEDKAGQQVVAAALIEEALKLSKNEDGQFDLYVMKPLFRATSLVMKQRTDALRQLPRSEQVVTKMEEFTWVAQALDDLVKSIK